MKTHMKGLVRKYQKLGLTLAAAAMLLTSGLSAHAAVVNTNGNTQTQSAFNQAVSSGHIGESSVHVWTHDEMLSAVPYPDTDLAGAPKTTVSEPLSTGPLTVEQGGAPTVSAGQLEAEK